MSNEKRLGLFRKEKALQPESIKETDRLMWEPKEPYAESKFKIAKKDPETEEYFIDFDTSRVSIVRKPELEKQNTSDRDRYIQQRRDDIQRWRSDPYARDAYAHSKARYKGRQSTWENPDLRLTNGDVLEVVAAQKRERIWGRSSGDDKETIFVCRYISGNASFNSGTLTDSMQRFDVARIQDLDTVGEVPAAQFFQETLFFVTENELKHFKKIRPTFGEIIRKRLPKKLRR